MRRVVRQAIDQFAAQPGIDDSLVRSALVARAVMACGPTVDTRWRWVHAIQHTEWNAPESTGRIDFHIERLRDSVVGASRLVRSSQFGRPVSMTVVEFDAPPTGRTVDLQETVDFTERHLPALLKGHVIGGLVDIRPFPQVPMRRFGETSRVWMRTTKEMPDVLLEHVAVLVLAVAAASRNHAAAVEAAGGPSTFLRHLSLRVHRGFRVDDWLACTLSDTSHSNHRRCTGGQVHSAMGRLVATVSQESLDGSFAGVVS